MTFVKSKVTPIKISAIKPPTSLTIIEGVPIEDEKKPLLSEMFVIPHN